MFVYEDHRVLRDTGYLNFIMDPVSPVYGYISNRSCTTTELSINLASCITAIKYTTVIKYCKIVYERNGKICFGLSKIQVRFLIN